MSCIHTKSLILDQVESRCDRQSLIHAAGNKELVCPRTQFAFFYFIDAVVHSFGQYPGPQVVAEIVNSTQLVIPVERSTVLLPGVFPCRPSVAVKQAIEEIRIASKILFREVLTGDAPYFFISCISIE